MQNKIKLTLTDTESNCTHNDTLLFSSKDDYIGFRTQFMDWMELCGILFSTKERDKSLWPEKIFLEGMSLLGEALLSYYLFSAYPSDLDIQIQTFISITKQHDSSYIAQDLLGWALYRYNEYESVKDAFLKAIQVNPAGAGAMAGLMWCEIKMNREAEALEWGVRKAEICGRDTEEEIKKIKRLITHHRKI